MDSFEKLVKIFEEFPGIGPRQARRFAYFLLGRQSGFTEELSNLVKEIKKDTSQCPLCMRYSSKKSSGVCNICENSERDSKVLMVVAKDTDLRAIEQSGIFNGKYFVLGGLLPILEKEPEKRIRISALKTRVEKGKKEGLSEIILALNANAEGDNTVEFIRQSTKDAGIKISELGKGISTGTEIEYIDADTLKGALQNKHLI